MRKITTMLVTIILVIATMTVPAYAYDNSVTIYVDGREVNGVEAFMDGNDVIWVSDSYVAARKLFPDETADLYFPDLVEDRQLQDMANAFGYDMQVNGLRAYLTKDGENEGGNTGKPDDDYQSVTIYMDNKKVSGVSAYLDNDGDVWLENGYSALKKVFPDETKNEDFPDLVKDLLLEDYADEYGYEFILKGNKVYLSKGKTETEVTIYVEDKKVSGVSAYLDDNGDVWLKDGYEALENIFPEETEDDNLPNVIRDILLKDYAKEYGYKFSLKGNKVYLTKEITDVTIYVGGKKISNVKAYLDDDGDVWLVNGYSALRKLFPDETKEEDFPNTERELYLEDYADEYGYKLSIDGKKVYLTKRSTAEDVIIYIEGKKVSNVRAYIDQDGNIWLENGYVALKHIFPEAKNEKFPNVNKILLLEDYVDEYDYYLQLKSNKVYLTKEDPKPEAGNEIKVYVNDMRINVKAELDSRGGVLFNPEDIRLIFPEAKDLPISRNYSDSLKEWADHFGYQYIQKGVRVYLIKNWQRPLEIHCQGRIVDFPDLQPFVSNNRTMIPVRMVAEMLGCNVEWKGTTVEIVGQGKTIVLYLNSKVYTVNGTEYSMDTPTTIVKTRTVVPIRFIAEAFEYEVEFYGEEAVAVVTIDK